VRGSARCPHSADTLLDIGRDEGGFFTDGAAIVEVLIGRTSVLAPQSSCRWVSSPRPCTSCQGSRTTKYRLRGVEMAKTSANGMMSRLLFSGEGNPETAQRHGGSALTHPSNRAGACDAACR
jgi:hypothetical protein